jgi:hypothetical protein
MQLRCGGEQEQDGSRKEVGHDQSIGYGTTKARRHSVPAIMKNSLRPRACICWTVH